MIFLLATSLVSHPTPWLLDPSVPGTIFFLFLKPTKYSHYFLALAVVFPNTFRACFVAFYKFLLTCYQVRDPYPLSSKYLFLPLSQMLYDLTLCFFCNIRYCIVCQFVYLLLRLTCKFNDVRVLVFPHCAPST